MVNRFIPLSAYDLAWVDVVINFMDPLKMEFSLEGASMQTVVFWMEFFLNLHKKEQLSDDMA